MNYLAYTVRFLVILLWTALPALAHAAPDQPAVLVVGDSLSAAYGIPQKAGWVNLLQKRLADQRYPHHVINASISGETTSGGLARLSRVLDSAQPSVVIIELGGNDGLRGLPLASVRSNLAAMIERSLARDAQVLLVGMRLPPNYGPAYVKRFHQIYVDLAKQYHVSLLPFLLEGIADKEQLLQEDRLHPRAEAQGTIMELVWQTLEPMLRKNVTALSIP